MNSCIRLMFPPHEANLWHTLLYQIRESEGRKPPADKDLIIANTINSMIIFNACYTDRGAL